MVSNICPDCGNTVSATDGEYDTIYLCDCGFQANSDAEFRQAWLLKMSRDYSTSQDAKIARLTAALVSVDRWFKRVEKERPELYWAIMRETGMMYPDVEIKAALPLFASSQGEGG